MQATETSVHTAATGEAAPARFWPPFVAMALLWFTLGVSLPLTLYATNATEFSISAGDLLLVAIPSLAAVLALSAAAIGASAFLRRPRVVAVIFAFGVLAWFQGHVLVWQYGPLDGSAIDWAAYRMNGVVDGLIWGAALVFAIWRPLPVYRMAAFTASALLLMQTAVLVFTGVRAASAGVEGTARAFRIDESAKYAFSTGRNAILIVLDETQSDVFEEIVNADQSYASIFEGFTFFPDALAGSNFTELAVPALLTGRLYDNSVPKERYMREAFLESSVLSNLRRHGFAVEVYPWVGWGNESMFFDASLADNLTSVRDTTHPAPRWLTEKKAKEFIHLADLSLFRAAPHFLKPHVYDNQTWFLMKLVSAIVPDEVKHVVSADDQYETTVFASQAAAAARADRRGDVFKYYHLKGAHSPLTVTPDLEVGSEPVPFTRENYVLQYRASLRGLAEFFSVLKRLGIYDSSLIVVTGDHGSGYVEELYVDSPGDARPRSLLPPGASRRNYRKDKARGMPLVLVKRMHAAGPLQTSRVPVSVMDIPSTIASELQTAATEGGSMFDAGRAPRVRSYAAFDFSENKVSYVGPMTLYTVDGDVRDDASWTIAKILPPPAAAQP